jgi:nitroreductase
MRFLHRAQRALGGEQFERPGDHAARAYSLGVHSGNEGTVNERTKNAPASIVDTMNLRFSCRTYSGEALGEADRARLAAAAEAMKSGPFGSSLRFRLVAAAPGDERALKRLGTYGTIRGASAFIIGAARQGPRYLEDYGYAMERLILEATALGMGTCWIGGFFRRGAFARRIGASRGERLPAVTSVGHIPDRAAAEAGFMRRSVGGSRRKPWEVLFSDGELGRPLTPESAGPYAEAVEMVRRAPSASNRQPWRIVKSGADWHFFIRRTPGYPPRFGKILLGLEDLQRVDAGIALCHFELTARERGLAGRWTVRRPPPDVPDEMTEYSATWEE